MSYPVDYPRTQAGAYPGGRLAMSRRRGALIGLGLALLGAWGAVIPFVGPYFDYAYTPNTTWTWTAARFWLQVLPGAVTLLAGLLLLGTASRAAAWLASSAAVAAGGWYVIGPLVAPLWRADYLGSPVGDRTDAAVEAIGMLYGLGAAIILLASLAAGRLSALAPAQVVQPAAVAAQPPPGAAGTPVTTQPAAAADQPVGEPERDGVLHRRRRFAHH